MKIGEIAIIAHKHQHSENFIKSICKKIDVTNGIFSFGRFEANDELGLHLYGISLNQDDQQLSWDFLSAKMMGYVFIFDWDNQLSFDVIRPLLDRFSSGLAAPIVVVANIQDLSQPPLPHVFFIGNGIYISANCRFTYGQVDQHESACKILVLLIDMLLQRMNH